MIRHALPSGLRHAGLAAAMAALGVATTMVPARAESTSPPASSYINFQFAIEGGFISKGSADLHFIDTLLDPNTELGAGPVPVPRHFSGLDVRVLLNLYSTAEAAGLLTGIALGTKIRKYSGSVGASAITFITMSEFGPSEFGPSATATLGRGYSLTPYVGFPLRLRGVFPGLPEGTMITPYFGLTFGRATLDGTFTLFPFILPIHASKAYTAFTIGGEFEYPILRANGMVVSARIGVEYQSAPDIISFANATEISTLLIRIPDGALSTLVTTAGIAVRF